MRGRFQDQGGLFSYIRPEEVSYIRPEERIPADHPLREIRKLVREVLKELSHSFGKLYSHEGRPSIPPEQLLSVLLLQVFYGLRSERQLMEQLNYNLLFRWFVGLSPDDPVWDASQPPTTASLGDVVNTILPHTEADPVALLIQFLTCFGNIIGRTQYFHRFSIGRHQANLFSALVGQTSKARKGTSFENIRSVIKGTDPEWDEKHIQSGLSSGEGLIDAVRDPIKKWVAWH